MGHKKNFGLSWINLGWEDSKQNKISAEAKGTYKFDYKSQDYEMLVTARFMKKPGRIVMVLWKF